MYLKRLKDLREDNELKQINVANYLKMKQPQYARYEKGIRELPLDCLIKLAKLYKVSTDYILEQTNETKPYPAIQKKMTKTKKECKEIIK